MVNMQQSRSRWRLILGKHASALGPLEGDDARRDQALDYLSRREYAERGVGLSGGHGHGAGDGQETDRLDELLREAGLGGSSMSPARWLEGVRKLFPQASVDIMQQQAISRYGLLSLLTDPEVMRRTPPSLELVRTLLQYQSHLSAEAKAEARRIIRIVVREIEERLRAHVVNAVRGPRNRHQLGGRPALANLHWPATLKRNLRHYDVTLDTLVLEKIHFSQRQKRALQWELFILVDQSGSMLDSVIHSAVLAAIFGGLSSLATHFMLFDTEVVDLTQRMHDPVEVLTGVQLGGGTDIASAVRYCANKIACPQRSILVLISDFYEGGDEADLLRQVARLKQSGVKLLGLAALDARAQPDYDRRLGQQLTNIGMAVAAMTPEHLADWVGEIVR